MREFGRSTVRGKLLFVVGVTAALALLITGTSMAVYELRDFRQSRISDLTAQAEVLGLAAAPALQFEDPDAARDYLAMLKAKRDITGAAIYAANGVMFASYSANGAAIEFPGLPNVDGYHVSGDELLLFKRIVSDGEIVGTVGIRADYDLAGRLFDYVGILAAIMVVSLVGAVVVANRLQRAITGPISAITSVARNVMEQRDFSLRAPKSTTDEVGLLVDAFNGMLNELGHRTEILERSKEDLRLLNAELEDRVTARTAQLEAAIKELESFSYSVSHDLRAPLRAISGFAGLLQESHQESLDAEAQRKLSIISGQAARMGTLIDDLLAFSRLGRKALKPASLDMAQMAQRSFDRLNHDGDVHPEIRIGKLPAATADASLLEQVWSNLLSNAIKFSSKKDKPVVEVGAISEESENIYFVRDNGAGFDPRYTSKLFGVFQRLHGEAEFPGTGVGLALVHRIISRHGGRVWADGQPGDGATFHFSLPKEKRND
jgi:signal transduction histidine kinase